MATLNGSYTAPRERKREKIKAVVLGRSKRTDVKKVCYSDRGWGLIVQLVRLGSASAIQVASRYKPNQDIKQGFHGYFTWWHMGVHTLPP